MLIVTREQLVGLYGQAIARRMTAEDSLRRAHEDLRRIAALARDSRPDNLPRIRHLAEQCISDAGAAA